MNKLITALVLFFTLFLSSSPVLAQQATSAKAIVGSWQLLSKKTTVDNAKLISEEIENFVSPLSVVFGFEADGTGYYQRVYGLDQEDEDVFELPIEKWSIKGDSITIDCEYESVENAKFSIQGGNLIINTTYKEEGDTVSVRYVLKKI